MNLKQQAEIIAAAIAGKDILVQKRIGGSPWRTASSPAYTRFNFQDYIYEVAETPQQPLSIEDQARILSAASLGEQIEATLCPASHDSIWRPLTFPHAFDFTRLAYRVAEEKPKTQALHQYIVHTPDDRYCLSSHFYSNQEEAQRNLILVKVISPAIWTRIEVQA